MPRFPAGELAQTSAPALLHTIVTGFTACLPGAHAGASSLGGAGARVLAGSTSAHGEVDRPCRRHGRPRGFLAQPCARSAGVGETPVEPGQTGADFKVPIFAQASSAI